MVKLDYSEYIRHASGDAHMILHRLVRGIANYQDCQERMGEVEE